MQLKKSARGFLFGEFVDIYGSRCSIQESSLATDSALWLGVNIDFENRECTRMHLSQELASEPLPLLAHFAEHGCLPSAHPGAGE